MLSDGSSRPLCPIVPHRGFVRGVFHDLDQTALTLNSTSTATSTPFLRLIDPQVSTTEIAPVQRLNRRIRGGWILHLDERKATGPTRLTIHDDIDTGHASMLFEFSPKLLFRQRERNVSNIDSLSHYSVPSPKLNCGGPSGPSKQHSTWGIGENHAPPVTTRGQNLALQKRAHTGPHSRPLEAGPMEEGPSPPGRLARKRGRRAAGLTDDRNLARPNAILGESES